VSAVLDYYLAATANLLQSPAAPTSLYSTADLTLWINTARWQVAGEGQCIRNYTNMPVSQGQRQCLLSSVGPFGPGIAGVLNVRTMWRTIPSNITPSNLVIIWTTASGAAMNWTTTSGAPMVWSIPDTLVATSGQVWMTPRPFEWFSLYELNNAARTQGPPQRWSQLGQGAAGAPYGSVGSGSLWIAPEPDGPYLLALDAVCYPTALIDDTTPEAIPFMWTDAVPYYAAYLAYLSAQSPARQADALRMFGIYQEFVGRARRFTTPGVLPNNLPQNPSPTMMNQLGIQPPRSAA
jgi:hypothetical protein